MYALLYFSMHRFDRRRPLSSAPLHLSQAKASRADAAYARLKRDIRDNLLPPGFQAPEPEIAARLGMSRTPVREALVRLEAEGMVELVPRRGARVRPLHAEDMRQIYDLLGVLEPHAAATLAAAVPRPDLEPLEQATTRMEQALDRDDLDAWAAADDDFHRHLLALQPNRRMAQIVGALCDQVHRARMVTLRLRQRPLRSTAEHRLIVVAIREGDAEKARRLFTEHRRRAAVELVGLLQTLKLPPL
jgi:DNA-binding GntR family transcriptional regulator